MKKLPMQPIEIDGHGVARFRRNKIVDWLYKKGVIDLNEIARLDMPDEDQMQFAQLLGYSVSGFGDLSYASRDVVRRAYAKVSKLIAAPSEQK